MGHPGAEFHHDRKKLGVCNAKDLEVSRLQETVNMEQFILLRDGLDGYPENSLGWNRSTKVLETVRSWAFKATPQRSRRSRASRTWAASSARTRSCSDC